MRDIGNIIMKLEDLAVSVGDIKDREGFYISSEIYDIIEDLQYYLPSI